MRLLITRYENLYVIINKTLCIVDTIYVLMYLRCNSIESTLYLNLSLIGSSKHTHVRDKIIFARNYELSSIDIRPFYDGSLRCKQFQINRIDYRTLLTSESIALRIVFAYASRQPMKHYTPLTKNWFAMESCCWFFAPCIGSNIVSAKPGADE